MSWDGDRRKMSTDHLEFGLVLCTVSVNSTIYSEHGWERMAVLWRNDEIGEPGCFLAFFYVSDIIIYEEILRIPRTPDTEIPKLNHRITFQCKIYSFYHTNHLDCLRWSYTISHLVSEFLGINSGTEYLKSEMEKKNPKNLEQTT